MPGQGQADTDTDETNSDEGSTSEESMQNLFNLMYQKRMKEESDKVQSYSFCRQILYILTKCDFMNVLITLTALYLVMSGI